MSELDVGPFVKGLEGVLGRAYQFVKDITTGNSRQVQLWNWNEEPRVVKFEGEHAASSNAQRCIDRGYDTRNEERI
ncbi:hypothetical protein NIL11_27090, partial [Klebsiella pneumoniae]|uniref:hypothetical protein n=1 Tax=Klebsiella pneumoniae TaxID=573 RepID=UPI0021F7395C